MFFGQRQVPLIHCNFTITKYINVLIFIYELLYFSFNPIFKKRLYELHGSHNFTVIYTNIFSLLYKYFVMVYSYN